MSTIPSDTASELQDLPPAADRYIGQILSEKYRIVRKLGDGGMGAVYAAEHVLIGKRVAVKFLHGQFASNADIVRRFLNEARAAATIGHENIIDVSDMGRTRDGEPYIVMEFLEGHDFDHEIDEKGALPVARVLKLIKQVATALSAAHAKGIVHRDMKPENIFLVKRGDSFDHVKVLDFGISKVSSQEGPGTRTGATLGTPSYMSPEQIMDTSRTDGRTDIYAVGVIMYRALTGRLPFQADSFAGLAVKVITETATPVQKFRPDLPDAVARVVEKAMAREAEQRFQNMDELAKAIDALSAGADPGVASVGPAPSTGSPGAPASQPTMGGGPDKATIPDPLSKKPAEITSPGGTPSALALSGTLVAESSPSESSLASKATQPGGSALAAGVAQVVPSIPTKTPEPAQRTAVFEGTPARVSAPTSEPSATAPAPAGPATAPSRTPMILGAVVVVLGIGLGAMKYLGGSRTETTTPPVQATPAVIQASPQPPTTAGATQSPVQAPVAPGVGTQTNSDRVALDVVSTSFGASVVFRGQSRPVPFHLEVDRGNARDAVEVRAPGHSSRRYWITLDQDRRLNVVLRPGREDPVLDATGPETLAALGAPTEVVNSAMAQGASGGGTAGSGRATHGTTSAPTTGAGPTSTSTSTSGGGSARTPAGSGSTTTTTSTTGSGSSTGTTGFGGRRGLPGTI